MELSGRAKRLTVFVGEEARHDGRPLATEIVQRAHAAGLAGATVLRGVEGFGASHHVHTTRILSLSNDLPIVVVIVDAVDRVEAFLPTIRELATDGLVTLEDVDVVAYGGRTGAG